MGLERIFSVSGLLFYGQDNWVAGVEGESLQLCALDNCYYDAEMRVIKNKAIWMKDFRVTWVSSNIGEVSTLSSMTDGQLRKDGNIVPQGSLPGVLGWDWLNPRQIVVNNGVVNYGEDWRIDYEQLVAVTTPILDIGQVVGDWDILVDGYVSYPVVIQDRVVTMTQVAVVSNDGVITCEYNVVDSHSLRVVQLRDGSDILVLRLLGNKVFVDRSYAGVEVLMTYDVLGQVYLTGDVHLYWRGSDIQSQVGELPWNECGFCDVVYPFRYYQLLLRFAGDLEDGYFKVYSLGLRKRKEV